MKDCGLQFWNNIIGILHGIVYLPSNESFSSHKYTIVIHMIYIFIITVKKQYNTE